LPEARTMKKSSDSPKKTAPRADERAWRELFNATNDAIFVHDAATGRIMDVNDRVLEMYGATREETLQPSTAHTQPAEPPYSEKEVQAWIRKAVEIGPQVFEWHSRRKNGEPFWSEVSLRKTKIGGHDRVLAVVRDITERKRMEEALRQREDRYRLLFNSGDDATFVHKLRPDGLPGQFIEVNDVACRLYGYTREEMLRMGPMDIDAPEGLAAIPAAVERLKTEGRATWEGMHVTKDGRKIPVEISNGMFDFEGGSTIIASARDITERKRAEAQLQFQAMLLDQISDTVTATDLDGRITFVNDAQCGAVKRTQEELLGSSVETYGDDPTRGVTQRQIIEGTRTQGSFRGEVCNRDCEGREFIIDCRTTLIRDTAGRPIGMCGVGTDITERKRLERELAANVARLQAIVENAPECVKIISPEGALLEMNPAGLRMIEADSLAQAQRQPLLAFVAPEHQAAFRDLHQRVIRGESGLLAFEVIGLKGGRRWLETQAVPLQDPNNGGTNMLGVTRDITDHKRAEEALRRANEQERLHFEQTPLAVIEWNLEFKVTRWNPAAEKVFGYGAAEAFGQHAAFIVPEAVRPRVEEIWNKLLARQGGTRSTNENLHKDGRRIFCEWYNTPLADAHGRIVGVASLVMDVTDRRRAENQLRDSEQLYHSLVENLPQSIFRKDLAGRFIFANQQFCRSVGRLLHEILGHTDDDICPPELAARYRREDQRVIETGQSIKLEAAYQSPTQGWRSIWVVKTPLRDAQGNLIGLQGISWDITERKRAEEALAERERRYRSLFDLSPAGILLEDTDANILEVNAAMCRLFGYSREELVGQNIRILVPPENYVEVERHLDELLAGKQLRHEVDNVCKDGQILRVEIHEMSVPLPDGRQGILAVVNDITERKRAEAALQQSRADLERAQAVGHVGSWISELNPPGKVLWSPETCRIFGFTRDEFDNRLETFLSMVHPDDVSALQAARRAAVAGENPYEIEHRIIRRDGELRWLQYKAEIERDAAGNPLRMVGVVQDVTERRLLEEQLRHLQKMESVGQLAAGVAHDFNNILTVINGSSAILSELLRDKPECLEWVANILAAGERAANLTRQLLLFSRKQQMQPKSVNLNELTSNLTKMLGRVLGEDITLEFSYDNDLPAVQADPGMLEQVIINLAVNARDAMPQGGRLHIATSTVNYASSPPLANPEARPGRFVRLAVRDTGLGIPPEIRERIFEPFFTTKEVGKGTGLGLATVFGIITQHGGWIEVDSKVDQGTTFLIFLPASPGSEPEKSGQIATPAELGHGETILVVEDDASVRELILRALTRQGYKVMAADSGAEARQLPSELLEQVDLMVTDLVMPGGVNGRELAESLRRLYPRLRVIYCSGYSPEMAGGRLTLEQGVTFIQKPFTPRQLLSAVAESLRD